VAKGVEKLAENPRLSAQEAVEQQRIAEPRRVEDGFIEAEGKNTYQLKRSGQSIDFIVRRDGLIVGSLRIPLEDMPIVKRLWQEA